MSTLPPDVPGNMVGWPSLRFVYRTDADKVADILPPGFEPLGPEVHIHVYQVPIMGEAEYGVVTKVPAAFNGDEGYYQLGVGIDQEQAIFISQELNGQPKFPCTVRYFRIDDTVVARASHQGYTFLEFQGDVTEDITSQGPAEYAETEWWIKSLRALNGVEKEYDYPPHVIKVSSSVTLDYKYAVDGELLLRDSPWDPIAALLPMLEQQSVTLHKSTMDYRTRSITNAGPLDPVAFWAHADVIGGSRWPGRVGGPRPTR